MGESTTQIVIRGYDVEGLSEERGVADWAAPGATVKPASKPGALIAPISSRIPTCARPPKHLLSNDQLIDANPPGKPNASVAILTVFHQLQTLVSRIQGSN